MFVWSKAQAQQLLSTSHDLDETTNSVEVFHDASEDFKYHQTDQKYYKSSNVIEDHMETCVNLDDRNEIFLFPDREKAQSHQCPARRELTSDAIFPPSLRSNLAEPITAHSVTPEPDQKQYGKEPNPLQSLVGIEFPDERPGRPWQSLDVGLSDPSTLGHRPTDGSIPVFQTKNHRTLDKTSETRFSSDEAVKNVEVSKQRCESFAGSLASSVQPTIRDDRSTDDTKIADDFRKTKSTSQVSRQIKTPLNVVNTNLDIFSDAIDNLEINDSHLNFGAEQPLLDSIVVHIDDATSSTSSLSYQNDYKEHYGVPWHGRNILDVGAGDGHVTRILSDEAASVSATEISAIMRARLRQKGFRSVILRHMTVLKIYFLNYYNVVTHN